MLGAELCLYAVHPPRLSHHRAHMQAVFVAVKNKMDLSIAVALGSSIQVRCAARAVCCAGCTLCRSCAPSVLHGAGSQWACLLLPPPLHSQRPPKPAQPPLVLPPQIAVFLIPVVVLVGWAMGKPFTLDFDSFAVSCLLLLPSFFGLQVAAVHPCLWQLCR